MFCRRIIPKAAAGNWMCLLHFCPCRTTTASDGGSVASAVILIIPSCLLPPSPPPLLPSSSPPLGYRQASRKGKGKREEYASSHGFPISPQQLHFCLGQLRRGGREETGPLLQTDAEEEKDTPLLLSVCMHKQWGFFLGNTPNSTYLRSPS